MRIMEGWLVFLFHPTTSIRLTGERLLRAGDKQLAEISLKAGVV